MHNTEYLYSDEKLYNHLVERFCTRERYIKDEFNAEGQKSMFEQLFASEVFGIGPIGKDFAKEFDEMTKKGNRKDMAIMYFRIYIRWLFKLLMKPEFYVKGYG